MEIDKDCPFPEKLGIKPDDADNYPPLMLAFVGDAVFSLFIRTWLVSGGNASVRGLHKKSTDYVKARAQSDAALMLLSSGMLDKDEEDIMRRGRNTKSTSIPKNAAVTDYRRATGLECLIGQLYLKGKDERLLEIMKAIIGFDGQDRLKIELEEQQRD